MRLKVTVLKWVAHTPLDICCNLMKIYNRKNTVSNKTSITYHIHVTLLDEMKSAWLTGEVYVR